MTKGRHRRPFFFTRIYADCFRLVAELIAELIAKMVTSTDSESFNLLQLVASELVASELGASELVTFVGSW